MKIDIHVHTKKVNSGEGATRSIAIENSSEQISIFEGRQGLLYARRFGSNVELTTREAVSYFKEHGR